VREDCKNCNLNASNTRENGGSQENAGEFPKARGEVVCKIYTKVAEFAIFEH